MSERKRQLLDQARAALRVTDAKRLAADEALKLAKALARLSLFSHAAAVLAVTLSHLPENDPLRTKMTQQEAVFTYKDTSQGVHERLAKALSLIESLDLENTKDQETLGIAGSIYRRRWSAGGRREDLEKSAEYYCRGERIGIAGDNGYTAINAAFVLDLLAQASSSSDMQDDLHRRSTEIRVKIAAALPARVEAADEDSRWWIVATLVEAMFGLGQFDQATQWLQKVDLSKVDLWQRETTAQQLAALARLHAHDIAGSSAAWDWIATNFPEEAEGLKRSASGRVGLAMSGGGFRASLVHLGVLARLAELDVLRHVEVLSTVSGGSIIGAYYYLSLRHLLQSKTDAEITTEDYINIVRSCMKCMLDGIRRNLRTRSLAEALPNLRVLYDPEYTRTDRIAELYDEYFYSCAPGASPDQRQLIRDLGIVPKDCPDDDFLPERHNWRRRNKVPTLVLNATALNTGHNWQFTPAWMGESRHHINSEIDANYHLRRMYYEEAPPKHRDLPLSRAVAASSCVPGLFPPVRLMSLYDDKLVALVDGAIHDNQGIASLLAEDCGICIISDGAGHMKAMDEPGLSALAVGQRTMSILQMRLREIQHRELTALQRGAMVKMCFLHLKKGMAGDAIPWIGCETRPLTSADEPEPDDESATTAYGISKRIQSLLARMRTDLDSFSDTEAYALMYDGYRIASHYIPKIEGLPVNPDPPPQPWPFLKIAEPMQGKEGSANVEHHLAVGAMRAGKVFKTSQKARNAAKVFLISTVSLFLLLVSWASWKYAWTQPFKIAGWIFGSLAGLYGVLLGLALVVRHVRKWWKSEECSPSAIQIATDLLVFTVGWIPARLHLAIGNAAYLQAGSMEESQAAPSAGNAGENRNEGLIASGK